jgi:plastocyanin
MLARRLCPLLLAVTVAVGWSPQVLAGEIEVKTVNRAPSGAFFAFAPEMVRIEPGDSVNFIAADKGHEGSPARPRASSRTFLPP